VPEIPVASNLVLCNTSRGNCVATKNPSAVSGGPGIKQLLLLCSSIVAASFCAPYTGGAAVSAASVDDFHEGKRGENSVRGIDVETEIVEYPVAVDPVGGTVPLRGAKSNILASDVIPDQAKTQSLSSDIDKAWEAEMKQALRNLEDELEIVRQARELEEENEDKDEDEEDVDEEDELEAIENSKENYSFVGDKGDGLLKTVNKNCTSISITFHSLNETKTSINFGGCHGYSPAIEAPTCDQDISAEEELNFPLTCTYRMEFHGDPGALKLIANNQGEETDIEEMLSKRRGKHTKQHEWFSKAAKRISYGENEGSCKPKYHGRAVRGIDCDVCGFWPCNCNCRGWQQKTVDCWKPCRHYNDEYTQEIGYHCWKPCDREGQLALNVGCGFGPYDRTCHASTGDCIMKYVNHAISIMEVLSTLLSGGVAGAFKTAIKTAVKAGSKLVAKRAIKEAIRVAAKEFAKSLMNSKAIQKKARKFKRDFKKDLKKEAYEQGSELFLASSCQTEPDFGAILDEVAEAVDPTGIYGMVKGWIPPESCDETVYLADAIPDEESGLPDIGALDGMTDTGGNTGGNIVDGAQVLLKQPDHGTYLGMCGHVATCGGSKYGVFGYPSTSHSRTTWTVEREGNYIHLKQADHKAYLGFCGINHGCDGSSHGAYGYSSRSHHRTKFQIEQSGSYYYLKQVDHSYLGMCGSQKWCGGSHHGVLGYSSKKSRTRWQIQLVSSTTSLNVA